MSELIEFLHGQLIVPNPQNAQAIMWHFVGNPFWVGYSLVCALGALLLFIHLLKTVERNALTLGRMLWLSGLIVGAFSWVNSGCQPWSAALMASAGTYIAVLVNTRWCDRPGGPHDKIRAMLGEWLAARRKVVPRRVDGD